MHNTGSSRFLGLLMIMLTVGVLSPSAGRAASAAEIDAVVAATLAEFRRDVAVADEYLTQAKGVLVIPDVKKVGFVVAAQWGTGALLVDGNPVGYYEMRAGSAGFQAGYKKADYVFVFLTQSSLDRFREGKGWTIGAETGITLIEKGAGIGADTLKSQDAVAAFVLGEEGLMGGWSGKGTKFTRVEPGQ